MLEIKPSTDRKLLAAYCKKCGAVPSEAFYLFVAANNGKILAAELFEVLSDQVRVVYYEAEDKQDAFLFDGLLRAGLNYASRQGITVGSIPEAFRYEHRALFEQLNYPAPHTFDITNFFQKYKNCML